MSFRFSRLDDDDRRWLVILAGSLAVGLAVSWQRWANAVIDSGREMNQPLRLAGGEMLYSDVAHIYGPLSPYLHAALYRLFGASLTVLYADGLASAVVILALVYFLGRRILSATAAGAAALTVMWLCALKPAGNYLFPYSFSALHGTALGLATLALAAAALARPSLLRFAGAGSMAGAALLAKTEMGVAAIGAGLAAAWLASPGRARDAAARALAVAASAAAVAIPIYALVAARVGWHTLLFESWLLPVNLPPPLVFFNAAISGFDDPVASMGSMARAAVKLVLLAAGIGTVSVLAAGPPDLRPRARWLLTIAVAAGVALSLTVGLDWDSGPFLAMPIVLVALLARFARGAQSAQDRLVALYAIFALLQLARTLLHVRSGGAYGSLLLPMSVVLFTYAWMEPFAGSLPIPAQRVARTIVLSLLLVSAAGTAIAVGVRYRRADTAVATARGTLIAPPQIGAAWNEALAFIALRTRPGDPVAVLPEGTSLLFLSGRRNPLRDDIVIPGILDAAGEARAIDALDRSGTAVVLIVNRATREFGAESFGRDYCRRLMEWIGTRYARCATFGAQDPALQVGDPPFFVHAYCRR
jgi:hypothetical protein